MPVTPVSQKLAEATSKKSFLPPSGPISGILSSFRESKGVLRSLLVETLWGSFEAKLSKDMRQPLHAELVQGMAIRLWLRVKGSKVRALLVVPLEARQVVYTGAREACIWVCTSKSCCRRGGSELLKTLQEAAQTQLEARLEVKKCGCLGTCKKGPSLKVRGDKKVHQVSPCSAPQWLETIIRSRN
jgi:(2Fe-2S) ferredoxin